MASVVFIGGCAGVFAGGWLADRLGTLDRGWYAKLPAIAWFITAPTFAAGLLAPNPWVAWPLLLIPNALNIFWLGPVIAAVQHLVPQRMRSTASASFLLINNLIGLGVGPYLIGSVSEFAEGKLWRRGASLRRRRLHGFLSPGVRPDAPVRLAASFKLDRRPLFNGDLSL